MGMKMIKEILGFELCSKTSDDLIEDYK